MSNEVYPSGAGTLVRAKIESSYGTDPTIADTDVKYAEEVESNPYQRTSAPRPGMSSRAGGFKSNAGAFMGVLALVVPLFATTLADASARPSFDVWLRSAAFSVAATDDADYTGPGVASGAGSNDIILTYSLESQRQSSCRVHVDYIELGQADALRHVHAGCVFDFSIALQAGQPVKVSLDGQSLGAQPASIGSAPSLDDPFTEPVDAMALGMHVSVENVRTGTVWGGGSVTAPNTAGTGFVSLEIEGNRNVVPREGMNGTGGYVGFLQNPSEAPTGMLRVDLNDPESWSWWDALNVSDLLHIRAVTFAPGSTTDLIEISFYCQAESVEGNSGDALRMVDVGLRGCYPDNSSDGGGLLPASMLQIKLVTINAA